MIPKKKILITGVAGYIGSCLYKFIEKDFIVFGIDKKKTNLNNCFKINLLNIGLLEKKINIIKPDLIIHLAGQSLVDENINNKKYYLNNVLATNNLVKVMNKINIKNIIFSSTAAVYKETNKELFEYSKILPKSNYSKTKLIAENYLKKSNLNYIILRFFNVCSSLNNFEIGEFHKPETHLIPIVVWKAIHGQVVNIFGKDYSTNDGTCIRDYIHILDICSAIKKLAKLTVNKKFLKKKEIFNLGTGNSYSILQIIKRLENITNKKILISFKKRRNGDVSKLVCNYSKINKQINWKPRNSKLDKLLKDEIQWVKHLKKNNLIRKINF